MYVAEVSLTLTFIVTKRRVIGDPVTCLLRNQYTGQEETERNMEQQTGSNLGKDYIKAVCCHPAY